MGFFFFEEEEDVASCAPIKKQKTRIKSERVNSSLAFNFSQGARKLNEHRNQYLQVESRGVLGFDKC